MKVELNPSKQLSQKVANRKWVCTVAVMMMRRDPRLKSENFLKGAYMRVKASKNMRQLLTSEE